MKFSEHCEPIFKYVCQLMRMADNEQAFNATLSVATVKKDIERLFREFDYQIHQDDTLEGDPEDARELVTDFVNVMVTNAGLTISKEWETQEILSQENGYTAIYKRFFDALTRWLSDTKLEANDRLQFFHTCLGLGFAQKYAREHHSELLKELDKRIDRIVQFDTSSRLFPDAYEQTNNDNYMSRPLPRLFAFAAALIVMFAGIFYVVQTGYQNATVDLVTAVDEVLSKQKK